MSPRDITDLLAETADWLRRVRVGGAAPSIEAGIAEITRLRAEVERLRAAKTNHDAAPATRADADRERPDNPPARPGDGTGDTPTLTDAERDDLEMWLAECLKQADTAERVCEVECADRWAARAARAAAILARHGGER